MNLLKIEIKEKEILKIEIEDNYRPYAFVMAIYAIIIISTYYTTWMYPSTMNNRFDELTTMLVIVFTSIYLANRK